MIIEESLSPATKYIALPSVMGIALGGALLYHSENIKDEYKASLDKNHHYQIQALDDVLQHLSEAEKSLDIIERGNSESFYELYRIQIKDLELKVEQELKSVKSNVPASILEKQESLKNEMENYNTAGWIFESIGIFGIVGYGLLRLLARHIYTPI